MREAYEMKDVSGDNRIANAPQLPRHPMYRGETAKDKRFFVMQYQIYYNTLLAYKTCLKKSFVMPVSACVEMWTKEQVIRFEMEKDPMEVTEEDWINFFWAAGEPDAEHLWDIDQEMRGLRMDTTPLDAGSKVARLRSQIYKKLHQHGLQEYVEQADPKRIVKWMIDALEPPPFKRKILENLTMEIRREMKRNHPVIFCKWCQGMLQSFMRWEPYTMKSTTSPRYD